MAVLLYVSQKNKLSLIAFNNDNKNKCAIKLECVIEINVCAFYNRYEMN